MTNPLPPDSPEEVDCNYEAGKVFGGVDAGHLRQPDDFLLLRSGQSFAGKQDDAKAANPRHARYPKQQDCDGPLPHSGENSEAGLSERVGS